MAIHKTIFLTLALIYTPVLYQVVFAQDIPNKTYLYFEVDELPIFGADKDQLHNFISENLTWPKLFDGEGEVVISFVVNSEGNVTNIRIVKSLCSECDEQVKEIFQKMPLWKPGTKNGKQVNVKMYVPVKFVLN